MCDRSQLNDASKVVLTILLLTPIRFVCTCMLRRGDCEYVFCFTRCSGYKEKDPTKKRFKLGWMMSVEGGVSLGLFIYLAATYGWNPRACFNGCRCSTSSSSGSAAVAQFFLSWLLSICVCVVAIMFVLIDPGMFVVDVLLLAFVYYFCHCCCPCCSRFVDQDDTVTTQPPKHRLFDLA